MMGRNRGGLPDRWLDYVAIGRQIQGLPIIACKVPLKEELVRRLEDRKEWFTPEILMERVPNVGCIVDLTATYRYYNPDVFTRQGVRHEKIFCEGHVVPNPTTVHRFFQVVDDFLHSVQSRGKVLMVHCTHGLNRTGYLVTRYMVERRGLEPNAAIAAFNEARGHSIERANYLSDIATRKLISEGADPPPAEEWWTQSDVKILEVSSKELEQEPEKGRNHDEQQQRKEDRASRAASVQRPSATGSQGRRDKQEDTRRHEGRDGRETGDVRHRSKSRHKQKTHPRQTPTSNQGRELPQDWRERRGSTGDQHPHSVRQKPDEPRKKRDKNRGRQQFHPVDGDRDVVEQHRGQRQYQTDGRDGHRRHHSRGGGPPHRPDFQDPRQLAGNQRIHDGGDGRPFLLDAPLPLPTMGRDSRGHEGDQRQRQRDRSSRSKRGKAPDAGQSQHSERRY